MEKVVMRLKAIANTHDRKTGQSRNRIITGWRSLRCALHAACLPAVPRE